MHGQCDHQVAVVHSRRLPSSVEERSRRSKAFSFSACSARARPETADDDEVWKDLWRSPSAFGLWLWLGCTAVGYRGGSGLRLSVCALRLAIGSGYRLEQDGNGCAEIVLGPLRVGGFGDEITRSADSVRFNIVEGCGLNSDNQLARCLKLSLGSANELPDQLGELDENGLLPPEYQDLQTETSGVRSMLVGFIVR